MTRLKFYNLWLPLCLAGCSLAPDYKPPVIALPDAYQQAVKWQPVVHISSTKEWWLLYGDETLNALEKQLLKANQNLKTAQYNYEEARALVAIARSGKYPQIVSPINATRQLSSKTLSINKRQTQLLNDTLTVAAVLNYEVDVWGRVRNNVLMHEKLSGASYLDQVAIKLSLQSELAKDYFSLRATDVALRLNKKACHALSQALRLTQNLYQEGAIAFSEVLLIKSQYATLQTTRAQLQLKRQQFAHAIAVLIGANPSTFHLAATKSAIRVIAIAPTVPSQLLVRRPDIAAAAYKMEAANAAIGIARAAFFPSFNISLMAGQQASHLNTLFSSSSNIWALGPSTGVLTFTQPGITQVLFDGFNLWSKLVQITVRYKETRSQYKQTILTAFQQVEDARSAIVQLDIANTTQTQTTQAARLLLRQQQYLYNAGATSLLELHLAQNAMLQAELDLVNIRAQRQLASVQLIKVLGGGW